VDGSVGQAMRELGLLSIGVMGLVFGLALPGCSGGGGKHGPTPTTTPVATASSTATRSATPSGTATSTASATAVATRTATATASVPPSATPTVTPTATVGCAAGPVQTTIGAVCGTVAAVAGTTVDAFLGIPFAEDTGGDNRWEPPVPKAMMQGTFQATKFGPICPQPQSESGGPVLPQSEDCLSVNVWVPASATPSSALPVMAFIYGGSFLQGSSALPVYDAAYLSGSQGVVVVTLNYRVGALGFFAGVHDLPGNYGLLDQQLALKWVRDNIGAFGGDATRLMLFGESAGAMSVGLHLLSVPSSADLFTAALMESNPFGLPYKGLDLATEIGTAFEKLLKCIPENGTPSPQSLACMRALPAATIVDNQEDKSLVEQGLLLGFQGLLLWAPVVDGTLVTKQPPAGAAGGLPKPTLLGTNKDEGTLFIYSALQILNLQTVTEQEYKAVLEVLFGQDNVDAILQDYPAVSGDNAPVLSQVANDYLFFCSNQFVGSAGGEPAYGYLFTQPTHFNIWPNVPQCAAPVVCHFAEVPYVFNTATNIGESFNAEEQAVSNAMLAYWSGFSRSGNDPNTGGESRPTWPTFSDFTYLDLGTPISTVVDPPHNCGLWNDIGYANMDVGVFLPAP
jgi:carboxylesterase type B